MGVESDLLPANRPEAGSSTTTLPDPIELATRRISQVEGQFESPTRYSRRSFLELAGLITVGIATGGAAYALLPRNDVSAATAPSIPKPLESKREPLLTAAEVFGSNVTTEAELRNNPDEIFDYQLITDIQGKVAEIVILSKKDNGIDTTVTRIVSNPQGKYDKGFQTSNNLPIINLRSVYKSSQNLLVGGETEPGFWIPALLESRDGGRTFTAKKLPISDGLISGINPIPSTNKLILNNTGSFFIYDIDRDTTIPILSGIRQDVSVGSIPSSSQNVTLYSEIDNRLSKDVINVDTGQVLSSEIVAPGIRVDSYALIKDSSGNVTGEVINDHVNEKLYINDKGNRRTLEYKGWLNNLNIPNLTQDTLYFTSLTITNGRIWTTGAYASSTEGLPRAIVASWPLNSDPNTNKDALTIYRIEDNKFSDAARMKWGIFSGVPGFLVMVGQLGLVFIETKADGSPTDNKAVTHLQIKDQAAPLHRLYLPYTTSKFSP